MIETLRGLNVSDHERYQAYRDAMSPLLERIGGGFRYDFTIAKTLRTQPDTRSTVSSSSTFRIRR